MLISIAYDDQAIDLIDICMITLKTTHTHTMPLPCKLSCDLIYLAVINIKKNFDWDQRWHSDHALDYSCTLHCTVLTKICDSVMMMMNILLWKTSKKVLENYKLSTIAICKNIISVTVVVHLIINIIICIGLSAEAHTWSLISTDSVRIGACTNRSLGKTAGTWRIPLIPCVGMSPLQMAFQECTIGIARKKGDF